MNETKKKYVFIDVDGTLIDPWTHKIPDSAVKAIKLASENGHKIFICTGRAVLDIEEFRDIGIKFDGYICSSGSFVEIDNSVVYQNFMSDKDVADISKIASRIGLGYVYEGFENIFLDTISYKLFSGEHAKRYGYSEENLSQNMREKGFIPLVEYDKIENKICKISVFGKIEDIAKIKELLPKGYNLTVVIGYTEEQATCAEINISSISKATSVDHVLKYYDADISDTISFGDSMNDYDLLQYTAIGVCMGNGVEELKKVADDITTAVDKDGLYLGFKKHGLI